MDLRVFKPNNMIKKKKKKPILRLRIYETEKGTPYFTIWCGRTRLKITNIKSVQEFMTVMVNVIAIWQDKKRGKWSYYFKTRGPKNWHFAFVKSGQSLSLTIQQLLSTAEGTEPAYVNAFEWKGTMSDYVKAYVELIDRCFKRASADTDVPSNSYIRVPEITLVPG